MDINYLAVVLSALSAFFLGYIWYTVVFAKIWQAEIGMKAQEPGAAMPDLGKQLVGSLILEILMAFALAGYIGTAADAAMGFFIGVVSGLVIGFAFGVNYLFEGRSFRHWMINAGYNLTVFAVMGLIIGAL